MGLSVNNNTAAYNTYRNLTTTQGQLSKSLEKLSSGYRINRAADDAAGLAISEGLRSQIQGLTQATRNSQDAINVVQTAEGALSESTSILQRMRTLAVQASSEGSINADAKSNIQAEVNQLKSELDRISNTTKFNGKALLDGTFNSTFQVGANSGETISVNTGGAMSAAGLKVNGVDVTKEGLYAFATGTTATAGKAVITTAAGAAATAVMTISTTTTNKDFAGATYYDASSWAGLSGSISFAGKTLDLDSVNFDEDNDGSIEIGEGLNQLNKAARDLWGLGSTATPFTALTSALKFTAPANMTGYTGANGLPLDSSAQGLANATPTFAAASGASAAIDKLDAAIKTVSTTRANLGAVQNRLEHTIANLGTATENLTASESSIRDVDMAAEMTKFTSKQILAQAGTAMLAQAKNLPQSVLSLLQG